MKVLIEPNKLYTNSNMSIKVQLPSYSVIEGEGTNVILNGTSENRMIADLYGNTSQNGTPTPSTPIDVEVVSGFNEVVVSNKNLFDEWISGSVNTSTGAITTTARNITNYIPVKPSTAYTLWREDTGFATYLLEYGKNYNFIKTNTLSSARTTGTYTTDSNAKYVIIYQYTSYAPTNKAQLEIGETASDYIQHQEQEYEINLGKNLFDKDNATILSMNTASVSVNATTTFTSASNQKHVYIKCEPNTTYTITKGTSINSILGIFESTQIPAVNVSCKVLYFSSQNNGTATITTGSTARFLDLRINSNITSAEDIETILSSIQIEKGNQATDYAPYFEPIELCKIGNYQDKTYRNNGKWWLHKEVEKIASYNGETISTDYISTTGSLTTGATIYYGTNATDTEITTASLVEELDDLRENMTTYTGQTNINQINSDLPFYLKIKAKV